MADPVSIIALVVSVASVAFIVVKEGTSLALGYRESSVTARRKREIDSKLRAEVRREIARFMILLEKDKRNEEKEFDRAMELGRSADYARSISGRLLEDMTQHMSSALGLLSATLLSFFLALYLGLNIPDFLVPNASIPFLMSVALVLVSFYMTTKQLRKHYLLRERFIRLGENPNLEYCRKLVEELKKEGIW